MQYQRYLFFLFILFISCKHEPEVSPIKICFSSKVLPVLISSCGECHNDGDFSVTSYDKLMASGLVKPGKPYGSPLYNAITQQIKASPNFMPPKQYARLSTEQTNTIMQWILQGAENTTCDDVCDTSNVTYNSKIAAIISNNCAGCHTGSGAQGGIELNTYAKVKTLATSGLLKTSVIDRSSKPMPPSQAINDCSINQLKIWIQNGTPEN